MSAELSVSIKMRMTFPLATFKITTKALVWGWISRLASSSVKEMIVFSPRQLGHMFDYVDLMARCYIPGHPYAILPCFSQVTGSLPLDIVRTS